MNLQREIIKGVIEQFLKCYVQYLKDNWEEWLLVRVFLEKYADLEATGIFLFFANYSYYPLTFANRTMVNLQEDQQDQMLVKTNWNYKKSWNMKLHKYKSTSRRWLIDSEYWNLDSSLATK